MERRLPQRDILVKVLVVLGLVPALALVAGSTRSTSSFYYDSQRIEGSISAGEWSTLPGVPAACLDWFDIQGNQLPDLGSPATVGAWVTKSFSTLLRVDDPRLSRFELVVLDGPSGTYNGEKEGQPPNPGRLIVVLSGSWTVTGTKGKDIIIAGPGETTVNGGNGRDCLVGGSGVSVLNGGNDSDLVIGGSGPTTAYGDNAKELLIAGTGPITLSGSNAPDVVAWRDSCGTPLPGDRGPQNQWVWSGDPAAPTVTRCAEPRMATLTAEPEQHQVEPEVATESERPARQAPAPQPEPTPEPPAPDQPVQPAQPEQPVQPDQQGPADQQVEPQPPAPTTQATSPTGEAGPTDGATASP